MAKPKANIVDVNFILVAVSRQKRGIGAVLFCRDQARFK
jgi:hypothetical protein